MLYSHWSFSPFPRSWTCRWSEVCSKWTVWWLNNIYLHSLRESPPSDMHSSGGPIKTIHSSEHHFNTTIQDKMKRLSRNIRVLALEIRHKGCNAPSLGIPMKDEVRMQLVGKFHQLSQCFNFPTVSTWPVKTQPTKSYATIQHQNSDI